MNWRAGDRCTLVNLRAGEVLAGAIEVVRGHKMVVTTADGRRWSADVDSSFVRPANASTTRQQGSAETFPATDEREAST